MLGTTGGQATSVRTAAGRQSLGMLSGGSRLLGRAPALLPALRRGSSAVAAAGGKKAGGKGGGKKSEGGAAGGGPYSPTVTTPVTEFSLRANSVVREPQIQEHWAARDVYERLASQNPGAPFTLHDGPPYANGDLHIGHALNKVLKDVINRYQLLQGRRARFVPGWDTHGLPIELKVLQALPPAERAGLDTLGLRGKARAYALQTVEAQKEQFKRYGVWADWGSPYTTLQPEYEAAQLRVFGAMFLNGHIYRGKKPVHWSPSSRTALAEAELEYPEGHTSRSIYVAMPITSLGDALPADVSGALSAPGVRAAFAIWTTTPWTIPANLAVAVNADLDYCLVKAEGEGAAGWHSDHLIVAEGLVNSLAEKFDAPLQVLAMFKGAALEGCRYKHPLFERVSPLVLGGDYITTESGTGLVHTAPGHGQEDYQVGLRYGLPLLSPVDDAGRFTDEAGPAFAGLNVQGDGNAAVVDALAAAGALLREESYAHKSQALEAIGGVSWVPAVGRNRITAMTEGRSDWCISRQRKWGVPIPVFYDKDSGEPLLTEETLAHVTALVAERGSDVWWTASVAELLPEALRGRAEGLVKGEDTMDVWFDSGSSWAGVLRAREGEGLTFPADLYLEGSDQHRGWFQSSLLTSVAATGGAPYKQVLTHGFVLDERGAKMSKSLGNVVDPRRVIMGGPDAAKEPPYGADVLRLWVASVDYANDVMIGAGILKQVAEAYRKLRGTLRFLLGNLADFDASTHAVPYGALPAVDRWLLARHAGVMAEVAEAYETYQFRRAYQALLNYVSGDLSSFYLDAAKDRCYIQAPGAPSRRACQTVQAAVLKGLLSALAPIVPHMAEDAWLSMPPAAAGGAPADSVFLAGWAAPPPEWAAGLSDAELARWGALPAVREAFARAMEAARAGKALGSSLEAAAALHVEDPGLAAWLAELNAAGNAADELKYLLIASSVELAPSAVAAADGALAAAATEAGGGGGVTVGVRRAAGAKCARCWMYSTQVGAASAEHPELCGRCAPVVDALGFKLPGAKPGAPQTHKALGSARARLGPRSARRPGRLSHYGAACSGARALLRCRLAAPPGPPGREEAAPSLLLAPAPHATPAHRLRGGAAAAVAARARAAPPAAAAPGPGPACRAAPMEPGDSGASAFARLPAEVLPRVLAELDVRERLGAAALVCRVWADAVAAASREVHVKFGEVGSAAQRAAALSGWLAGRGRGVVSLDATAPDYRYVPLELPLPLAQLLSLTCNHMAVALHGDGGGGGAMLPALTRLHMDYCTFPPPPPGLLCPGLHELHLHCCDGASVGEVLIASLTRLSRLVLFGGELAPGAAARLFARALPALRELAIECTYEPPDVLLSQAELDALVGACPGLHELQLMSAVEPGASCARLSLLSELTALWLRGDCVSDADVVPLVRALPALQHLSVVSAPRLGAAGVASLVDTTRLEDAPTVAQQLEERSEQLAAARDALAAKDVALAAKDQELAAAGAREQAQAAELAELQQQLGAGRGAQVPWSSCWVALGARGASSAAGEGRRPDHGGSTGDFDDRPAAAAPGAAAPGAAAATVPRAAGAPHGGGGGPAPAQPAAGDHAAPAGTIPAALCSSETFPQLLAHVVVGAPERLLPWQRAPQPAFDELLSQERLALAGAARGGRLLPQATTAFRKFVARAATPGLTAALLVAAAAPPPAPPPPGAAAPPPPPHGGDGAAPAAAERQLRYTPAVEAALMPYFIEFCRRQYKQELAAYAGAVATLDLRAPHTWYPYARAIRRKIIYHGGPTNSGKTYNALQSLAAAPRGVYCAPLRLLAMEVYETLNHRGVLCDLVTGQEVLKVPGAGHVACTVEMAAINAHADVAVIDEIQLIGDDQRGFAWSRALLGLPANVIHVCGDTSAVGLVRHMAALCGDEFELHTYERMTPLNVDAAGLPNGWADVQAGDAVVAFSRRAIYKARKAIEAATGQRTCIVYGALPAETRRLQARLFNDPASGANVLIASDAIGLGLNFNIRRVIFTTLSKTRRGGRGFAPVPPSLVKQIAGRAGRRNSIYPEGCVTTLLPRDLPALSKALALPAERLLTPSAGLAPEAETLELLAAQFPDLPLEALLTKLDAEARLDGRYFLCNQEQLLETARVLGRVKGLSLADQFTLVNAPVDAGDAKQRAALLDFTHAYAAGRPVVFNAALMPPGPPVNEAQMADAESLHKILALWLWLSFRFADGAFPGRERVAGLARTLSHWLNLGLANIQASATASAASAASAAASASVAGGGGGDGGAPGGALGAPAQAEEQPDSSDADEINEAVLDTPVVEVPAASALLDGLLGAGPTSSSGGGGGPARRGAPPPVAYINWGTAVAAGAASGSPGGGGALLSETGVAAGTNHSVEVIEALLMPELDPSMSRFVRWRSRPRFVVPPRPPAAAAAAAAAAGGGEPGGGSDGGGRPERRRAAAAGE
ncbi:ileS [Scenedesmus sp. PABB004]|nr:ileS [Scenedesmus sp. PABB004]